MKSLEDVKLEVAIESGYESWLELEEECSSVEDIRGEWMLVSKRFAEYVIDEAESVVDSCELESY